jgi:hypothetical protein
MSRLLVLASQPRMALGALLTLALAVGAVIGSGANFTASSANPTNTFTAGTLTMSNSKAGAAVLTASNMRPGDPASTGTVDIKNTGSLSGAFTVSRSALTDSDGGNPMSAKLNLTIVDCGVFAGATPPTCGDGDDVSRYSGTLSAMPSRALGTFAGGAEHRYEFSVALDGSAGDAYQGDSSSATFDWNAA